MWHVETDYFALAVFLLMLVKERPSKRFRQDIQGRTFYLVLVLSIANVLVDIVSSLEMNYALAWWPFQITMTVYVATMPLLAATWVCYVYVIAHGEEPRERLRRGIVGLMIPYAVYIPLALSNPATGLFFTLSSDVEYARGALFFPVGVGMIMFYSALGLCLVAKNRRRIEPKANVMLLALFFAITAGFTWVQLANHGWLIINASYAFIYVWCDFTVEEQRRRELIGEIDKKNSELRAALVRAESAGNAKTEFLSRMSHDIRTPMNAIIGLTHLAQSEDDPKKVQDYLGKIASSSDFLLGLINDILDMSKIENGDLSLSEERLAKESFESSIDTVIRPIMSERRIGFTCDLEGFPPCIVVDKLRFNQIFFNLLSNAAKFTPEGGEALLAVESRGEKDGRAQLRFTVRDTGVGMSREFQERMYDPFAQEQAHLGNTHGTGLGLPIVKSLVDAMGGTIQVESAPGRGTCFTVDVAVKMAKPEAEVTREGEMEGRIDDAIVGARILLVEDNELNVEVAQLILEQMGCVVETAENGQVAVARFSVSPDRWFDAVLMDVRMPIMDGIEATRAIRALDRVDAASVPIIAMTADAFDDERKRTLEAGMDYHLSKPIDPQLLRRTLARFIGEGNPSSD